LLCTLLFTDQNAVYSELEKFLQNTISPKLSEYPGNIRNIVRKLGTFSESPDSPWKQKVIAQPMQKELPSA
jgi:hypothetical protein